jgi:hypothetical protein
MSYYMHCVVLARRVRNKWNGRGMFLVDKPHILPTLAGNSSVEKFSKYLRAITSSITSAKLKRLINFRYKTSNSNLHVTILNKPIMIRSWCKHYFRYIRRSISSQISDNGKAWIRSKIPYANILHKQYRSCIECISVTCTKQSVSALSLSHD